MSKIVVGITSGIDNSNGYFSNYRKSYVSEFYVKSIIKANGIPVILPIVEDLESAKELVNRVDILLFSGGADVNPLMYNQEPLLKIGGIDPNRDLSEKMYFEYAKMIKKPIFGICRGLQFINVVEGGSLYQDLSYDKNSKLRHKQLPEPAMETHTVHLDKDSFLYDLYNKDNILTNTFHHQIVDRVAEGYKVTGIAIDGAVEVLEYMGDQFIKSVQFHPEMMAANDSKEMLDLFKYLIKVGEEYVK